MPIRIFFKILPLVIFVAFAAPQMSFGAVNASPLPSDSAENTQMIIGIKSRLTEIQQLDKANLSSAEKKDLRKELREMKQQVAGQDKSKGLYLSVGAILIIAILLLILLL